MRIVFLGATKFSEEMLKVILENNFSVDAIFSIPKDFNIKMRGSTHSEKYVNSNFTDLHLLAQNHHIPCYDVGGGGNNLSDYYDFIENLKPDIILVLGWYYIVPKKIRNLARIGTFGIHASLLPNYAGGSPLVWALINGEEKTGITMFKIEDGIDDGDILSQSVIHISFADTISSLYDKVIIQSKKMLVREINKLQDGTATFTPQDKEKIKPLPIRSPDDGLIDWSKSNIEIYNFVRAQTKPYPCAFSYIDSVKIKFISVEVANLDRDCSDVLAGTIFLNEGDILIKAGIAFVRPLMIEALDKVLSFNDYFYSLNNIDLKIFKNE